MSSAQSPFAQRERGDFFGFTWFKTQDFKPISFLKRRKESTVHFDSAQQSAQSLVRETVNNPKALALLEE